MKIFVLLAAIATAAILLHDPNTTPMCDILIKPDSTWQWRTTPTTDCEFPTWGIFRSDGTWDIP